MRNMKNWTVEEKRIYQQLCLDSTYADLKEGYPKPPKTTHKEHVDNLKSLLKTEANEFRKELLTEWIKDGIKF